MQSAPAEVTTDPESRPEQPETRPEQPDGSRLRFRWSVGAGLIVALLAVALGTVLLVGIRSRGHTVRNVAQSSHHANPNPILRLKGTTEAVQSRAVLAPLLAGQQVSTLTVIRLATAGTRVKPGDLLVEFDRQAQVRDFIDKQAEYSKLANQVLGEQAKENAARAKDETELKQAEDNLLKAELEMQKAEIVSRIDAEKNQETLEETRATFEQLRETFSLKRKAAAAAIRILEIQRDRIHETMLHAQANAQLMQIHSPIEGVGPEHHLEAGDDGRGPGGRSGGARSAVPAGGESFPHAGPCARESAGFSEFAHWPDGEGPAGCVSGTGVAGQDRTTRSHWRRRQLLCQAALVRSHRIDPGEQPQVNAGSVRRSRR